MIHTTFNEPQRQSKLGFFVLFFKYVYGLIKAMWITIFIVFARPHVFHTLYVIAAIIAIIVYFGTISALNYYFFTFYIDQNKNEFIVSHGIFNKTKTIINLSKIQQVNLKQNFLQKILNLYAVEIDSAGSDEKEGKIVAISAKLANELKVSLLQQASLVKEEVVREILAAQTPKLSNKIQISFFNLVKYGISSNYVRNFGFIIVGFFGLYEKFDQLEKAEIINRQEIESVTIDNDNITLLVFFLLIIMLLGIFLNLIYNVIKYFNFRIEPQEKSLVFMQGLFTTNTVLLSTQKVQLVKISQNLLQNKLKISELKIKQSVGMETNTRESSLLVPGIDNNDKDQIFKLIFDNIFQANEILKPNFRKLVFTIFIFGIIPSTIFFIISNFLIVQLQEYQNFAFGYLVIVGLFATIYFKNYKLFLADNFLVKQSGIWDIEQEFVQVNKIQAITTSQLFWHKTANIGSLTIHTAGGNIDFDLGNFERINELVNIWLYQIESSEKVWQ